MGELPFRALGGTVDLLPEEARRWQQMEAAGRRLLDLYGYQEIRTPLLEEAGVFTRSLGEAAEIVTKQMYLFQDRGGRSVALRPEGTASVVRAFIEAGLDKTGGLTRFYYLGPMFRAERPQAGRRRQFHQLGVEVFGSASPYQDAEVIVLLGRLLESVGVSVAKGVGDPGAVLKLNNLGCREDRPKMLEKLREYFGARAEELCSGCQTRLKVNPLRILDCKEEKCRSVAKGSISPSQWLCKPCLEHVDRVKKILEDLKVYFEWDNHLVRGLDYYTRTAFEVLHTGLGAQNAIGGGGRYDDLVEALGGASTPAIGFAVGLERIRMVQETDRPAPPGAGGPGCFVAAVSPAQIPDALALAEHLRAQGIPAVANLEERPLKRQMEQASRMAPKGIVLILGEEELRAGQVTVKEMATGKQRQVARGELLRECFHGS